MKFEINMLPVGNADAILLKYFNDTGKEIIILIDAGKKAHGKMIVNYINTHTRDRRIHLAICTHPDEDHIGGFWEVAASIPIDTFWIHDPNQHKKEVIGLHDKTSLQKTLRHVVETDNSAMNLLKFLDSKNIPRHEPFTGLTFKDAPIKVLGPQKDHYIKKLNKFRDIHLLLKDRTKNLQSGLENLSKEQTDTVHLGTGKDTSKENNSSVILLFEHEGKKFLFTSDADVPGLTSAIKQHDLQNLYWLQVPHHGSIHNMNQALIDYFNPRIAFISCSGKQDKPNVNIIKALEKRGTKVCCTFDGVLIGS